MIEYRATSTSTELQPICDLRYCSLCPTIGLGSGAVERLAVLGASGGAGIAAVEIGRLLGTQVIGWRRRKKARFCAPHGADHVINYAEEDLKAGLHRLTGGHGVDVVYDTIGGRYSELALRCMNWGGRHFVIGFASGGP